MLTLHSNVSYSCSLVGNVETDLQFFKLTYNTTEFRQNIG